MNEKILLHEIYELLWKIKKELIQRHAPLGEAIATLYPDTPRVQQAGHNFMRISMASLNHLIVSIGNIMQLTGEFEQKEQLSLLQLFEAPTEKRLIN